MPFSSKYESTLITNSGVSCPSRQRHCRGTPKSFISCEVLIRYEFSGSYESTYQRALRKLWIFNTVFVDEDFNGTSYQLVLLKVRRSINTRFSFGHNNIGWVVCRMLPNFKISLLFRRVPFVVLF